MMLSKMSWQYSKSEWLSPGCLAGHVTPPPPRDPPGRAHNKHFDPNDGCPPNIVDTLDKADKGKYQVNDNSQQALALAPASSQAAATKKKQVITVCPPLEHRIYQGYTWAAPNSCFWDTGVELLFRAFVSLPISLRTKMFLSLPPSSPLGRLFYHFQHWDEWWSDPEWPENEGYGKLPQRLPRCIQNCKYKMKEHSYGAPHWEPL
jgi:hypothetical protein